jgi:limonene 1,2-monooxygenase
MHAGLTFGIFLGPFHRVGDNPNLCLWRDLDLVQWLDHLGYDEAWFGEHHSAGWETIAAPELMIATAAERTRRIMLGSGVTSLPYHHPLMVANRFVQLDHMTRGRAMLGCGPGALISDAYMMGIDPLTQRKQMEASLDAIMRLLACEEPVTIKNEWFELKDARLHLAPYTYPHFDIAVASTTTPSGVAAAARHGLGILSLGAGLPGGPETLGKQWRIAEEVAAQHGKTMNRKKWRLVVNAYCAEDDERALREVRYGERMESVTYHNEVLGRPPGRSEDPLRDGLAKGSTLVGSPETLIAGIKRLIEFSEGGCGGILFRGHEWAGREELFRSYELIARHVMPHFQGMLTAPLASNEWVRQHQSTLFSPNYDAFKKAFVDAGQAVPQNFGMRNIGGAPQPRQTITR